MTRWFSAGLLGAAVLVTPAMLSAQARQGFVPGWERTALDFRKDGVWRKKGRAVSQTRANLLDRGDMSSLNAPLRAGRSAASAAAVTGVLRVPVVMFGFQNSAVPQPYPVSDYTNALFATSPPSGRPYTLRSFYEQMSNGLFSIQGDVSYWVRLTNPENSYTGEPGTCGGGNCNGINSTAAILALQAGMAEAIDSVDATVDFAQYDNDGPDGLPNSGDDDGFVDIVVFMHSEQDGACGGATNNHPWAHRFSLQTQKSTNDPRTGGGFVQLSDYLIQSGVGGVTGCNPAELVAPGTAAHELGHGLGLPDLYDTGNNTFTEGIGQWGLMGSGNYTTSFSPSRMEAWSLNEMGWVTLRAITTAGTYTLGPAPTSDTAFVLTPGGANPRGQRFLIENRQPVQADSAMIRIHCARSGNPAGCGGGVLIWHVDQTKLAQGSGSVNVGPIHGLDLIQADNVDDLRNTSVNPARSRGDAGDPYPGITNNTAFTPGSAPASLLNNTAHANGIDADFGIDQIQINGGVASMRIGFVTAVNITTAPTLTAGTMGAPYSLQLGATGGVLAAFRWTVTSGALPTGLTLSPGGLLQGTPTTDGNFTFTARAASGGQLATLSATLAITRPTVASVEVVKLAVTGASALSPSDVTYLDLLGNKNGSFDIGDFLAWVRDTGATGALREYEAAQRAAQTRTAKEK